MLRHKIFITNANLLRLTTEQTLRTLLEDHRPATISFAQVPDGVLTLIETATAEKANRVVVALARVRLGADALALVSGDSPQTQQLAQVFTEFKQQELERNWIISAVVRRSRGGAVASPCIRLDRQTHFKMRVGSNDKRARLS